MIVWGGDDGGYNSPNLNTGGRYNPTTDAWEPTDDHRGPLRTGQHTAVWTGTEMIVWGGWSGARGHRRALQPDVRQLGGDTDHRRPLRASLSTRRSGRAPR